MTAASRYKELTFQRDPYVRRARECASVTIASIMPPEGHSASSELPKSYSGFGARCVDTLANKLLLAFYPPGIVPFTLQVSLDVLIESGDLTTPPETQTQLSLMEKVMNSEIERKVWRKPTYLSLIYLIVTGNSLERIQPDNSIKVYRLDQYVVVRNTQGMVTELVIEEYVYPNALPEHLQREVATSGGTDKVKLYTWCKLNQDGEFDIHQEINDKVIEDTRYTSTTLPFNVLRWTEVIGESYGRGKVDMHYDDFEFIEGLRKSIIDGAALASLNINMIRPNASGGLNLRRRLAKAQNGDWVIGNPEDVGQYRVENIPSLQYIHQELAVAKQEVGAAFMMNQSIQRDAERVSAYEIRKLSEELEANLGGVFTVLSVDMQGARISRLFLQMQQNETLPQLPEGVVEPQILTGLQSIGREQDVQRVVQAGQIVSQMPERAQRQVDWEPLLTKVLNGLQLPDAVRPTAEVDEEIERERQQEAALQAAQRMAGNIKPTEQ